ncbi:MAG: 3-keto-disaccharide hydrolase [Planctomycetota bacterium]|jgi:hypothetical protein
MQIVKVVFGLLSCAMISTPSFAAADDGFISIFNGQDLTGWDGQPGAWAVRDGAIVGTGTEKTWLVWRGGEVEDFILTLQFKHKNGNSGVQVRSEERDNWQVSGYQAEVAEQEKMGLWHHSLWAEKYRDDMALAGQEVIVREDGELVIAQVDDGEAVKARFKPNVWNTMTIIARGEKLIQKVNGHVFVVLVDRDKKYARRNGVIALQGTGAKMDVAYKDIRLKRLTKGDGAAASSPFTFTPEAEGRREMTVRTTDGPFEWRLRIPERVFCDEGVPVGHDIFRVHGPVKWNDGEPLSFSRDNLEDTPRQSVPISLQYGLCVLPQPYGAELVLWMKNTGAKPITNLTGHVCLGHLSDAFRDPSYERVFVRRDGAFLGLQDTDRGRDPIRAHYRVKDQRPIKIFDNPDNRFWGGLSREVVDNGLILTRSKDGRRLIALWFENANEVFQNSDEPNMCIHSDPNFGDLAPGERVERKGRLILFEGGLDEFANEYLD